MHSSKYSLINISLLITGFLLITHSAAGQASPRILASWRAVNYTPSDFQGKIFPVKNTLVEVGADLLDRGKLVNLKPYEIRWYLDGALIKSGKGLQTITFAATRSSNVHSLKVRILDYKNTAPEALLDIPVKTPRAVITSFNPKKQASVGTNNFQALPYFFNIASLNDLNFTWSSDGKPIAGAPVNPSILNLNIASEGAPVETKMRIAAFIQNIKNPIEAATGNTTIIVK